jgi:hypothetical protein
VCLGCNPISGSMNGTGWRHQLAFRIGRDVKEAFYRCQ